MEEVINVLTDALNENFRESDKYLIADHPGTAVNPVVLTGSHNWSSSAELRNDENILIIHDDTIANLYYQEFTERFSNGKVIVIAPECIYDSSGTSAGISLTYNVMQNDRVYGSYQLNIIKEPVNGTASIPDENNITYTPNDGFTGTDSVMYKVCMLNDPALCDSAIFIIYTQLASSTGNGLDDDLWLLYPNPANDVIYIDLHSASSSSIRVDILDLSGKIMQSHTYTHSNGQIEFNISELSPGIYVLKLRTDKYSAFRKFVIQK